MTIRCEDYPCCGHTDGLGCGWTYTPEAQEFDRAHFMCDHEAGVCDLWPDPDEVDCSDVNDDDVDERGRRWCYGCDEYADHTRDILDSEPMEDQWLDGSYEE